MSDIKNIGFAFIAINGFLLVSPDVLFAANNIKVGNQLYEQEKYPEAIEEYNAALEKKENKDIAFFNLGAALYKDKKYQEAKKHFQNVLLSEEPLLKQKAQYNLGNTLLKDGIAKEETDLPAAVKQLEQSLAYYKEVFPVEELAKDAKYNYDFVETELKRLKEKLQQQEQQKQQQQQSDSKEEQQEQEQQKSSSPEDQSQQQESQQNQKEESQQDQQQKKEESQPQEEQQQQKQDQQQQEDQSSQQQSSGEDQEQSEQHQQQQGKSQEEMKEMSQKEAQMLLDSYQQNEEPAGLINFYKKKSRPRSVPKDW